MKKNEKKSFFRFMSIYLLISFLLFIALALYYYFEQKQQIENNLSREMSRYGTEFRDLGTEKFPKGFTVDVHSKKEYAYPAFIKENSNYKSTSCGGFDYPQQIIVVEASKEIIYTRLASLRDKIILFMSASFVINFFIALFLSWISLRPIRQANAEFKEFVEDIVHDLNAPVSAISINLESLVEICNDKKVHRIGRSVDTIRNLYLNLEVFLKSEYKTVYSDINIQQACKDMSEQLQSVYPDVTFKLQVPSIMVRMNSFAFERILVNLIQNAAKYAKVKPIVTLGIDEKNRFFIQDNGIGIKNPKQLFARAKQSNKKNDGYGLGLSIVKKLSEECDIPFSIESKENEGTTFYFDISKYML